MIAAQKEIAGATGLNLFAFTTPKRLAQKSALTSVWISGMGRDGVSPGIG